MSGFQNTNSSSSNSNSLALDAYTWDPLRTRFLAPKKNKAGILSVSVISQVNRSLYLNTPSMMTWGIGTFVAKDGSQDPGGNDKYTISLNFPNEEYVTEDSTLFLAKMKQFEEFILTSAVENSVLWWGDKMSYEVLKHMFFPFVRYPKNMETNKTDYTRPPSLRAKVPCYDGKWSVEIYDQTQTKLFPVEDNDLLTPVDFVPSRSNVTSILHCRGLWIGVKGWGLIWNMPQCVVHPSENSRMSIYGTCHVRIAGGGGGAAAPVAQAAPEEAKVASKQPTAAAAATYVEDSDTEEAAVAAEVAPSPAPAAPAAEETATPMVVAVAAAAEEATPVAAAAVVDESKAAAAAVEPPKKKVLKKKL